ncbi:unnamed protein product [Mytilus edulis]|uniref:Endonuclease/exonuclease/phosphatase domain-containing protein n=1 Tax=Mytilus edulis TaxID=6550 RepID=A0A8S3TKF0_MYTED|nr:unnamed protein product [Mytilus edulis]
MKSEVTAIRSENNKVAENMQKVQNNLDELQEKHLDLQIRSMRENLVFTGISMTTENEESDTTEGILKLFMKEDMKMETEIDFHRAHRFGQLNERKNRDGTTFKTKPIVCRFKSFKDREIVRKSATNLKGTTFGVSEQFPKEINERRKLLWPYYKEARKQNKKALIKRDRLFIDGKEIKPLPSDIAENTTRREENTTRREFQSQGARPKTRRRNRRDDITSDETAKTKLDDIDIIDCENFIFKYKNRKKISNYKSGGIAIGYKKYLEHYITVIESECPFVFWFSVKKEIFDFQENVIFGITYIPPENTNYASDEAFSEIEFEFQNFSKNNDYMCLLGDFNSRTATLKDFHEIEDTDDTQFNDISDINVFSDICILDDMNISRCRKNPDTIVNKYGRKLIEFCKNNNMFILNGRFGKDSIGRMTCKNKSVVDYIICTCNVLENILDFEVQEFCRLFSDVHSPLSLTLSCKNKKHSDLATNNFTPKIGKWKCEKTLDFRDNLDGEMIEKLFFKIQSLHNAKENAQKPEVDEVVFDLCNILLKSAETTFGLTSNKAHRHSKKQWFDLKCLKAKKEFRKSKRLCKKYGSNIFKERLRVSELSYKKTMDNAIVRFNTDFRNKMKNMRTKNPKEFWKLFHGNRQRDISKIPLQTLVDFFKDLNTNKDHSDDFVITNEINSDEVNEMINKEITADEIRKAVKKSEK